MKEARYFEGNRLIAMVQVNPRDGYFPIRMDSFSLRTGMARTDLFRNEEELRGRLVGWGLQEATFEEVYATRHGKA